MKSMPELLSQMSGIDLYHNWPQLSLNQHLRDKFDQVMLSSGQAVESL
jgi:hypothetical protein